MLNCYIFLAKYDEKEKYAKSDSSDTCIHCYNVEILNTFDLELQLINTEPMIKLLTVLKKFNVQTVLVLEYKKRNDCKILN